MNASMFTYRAAFLERARMNDAEEGEDQGEEKALLLPEEKRQGDADADELGQGQVDEDDPPLQDVDAEIGVDQDQEQARQKRPDKKIERFH